MPLYLVSLGNKLQANLLYKQTGSLIWQSNFLWQVAASQPTRAVVFQPIGDHQLVRPCPSETNAELRSESLRLTSVPVYKTPSAYATAQSSCELFLLS